jgi:hypothetical protein
MAPDPTLHNLEPPEKPPAAPRRRGLRMIGGDDQDAAARAAFAGRGLDRLRAARGIMQAVAIGLVAWVGIVLLWRRIF